MRSLTVGELKEIIAEVEGVTDNTLIVLKFMEHTDWNLAFEAVHFGRFENGGIDRSPIASENYLILDADMQR